MEGQFTRFKVENLIISLTRMRTVEFVPTFALILEFFLLYALLAVAENLLREISGDEFTVADLQDEGIVFFEKIL